MITVPRIACLTFIVMALGLTLSCAHLGLQTEQEEPFLSVVPECERNYKKEGVWPFRQVHSTWVKYDPLDYKRGFEAALMAIKTMGYRTIYADPDSGIINAEMIPMAEGGKSCPTEVKLLREKNALTVHLSSDSLGAGSAKDNFCAFYREFEKALKRSQSASATKQNPASARKAGESERDSASSSPASVSEAPKSSAPPTSSKSLPKTQVSWSIVNLREGPGTNYKVLGKARKGTSLTILEERDGWYFVRLDDGKEAWVSKNATSEGAKTQAAVTSSPSPRPPQPPVVSPSPTVQSSKPLSPM